MNTTAEAPHCYRRVISAPAENGRINQQVTAARRLMQYMPLLLHVQATNTPISPVILLNAS